MCQKMSPVDGLGAELLAAECGQQFLNGLYTHYKYAMITQLHVSNHPTTSHMVCESRLTHAAQKKQCVLDC